MAKTDVWVVDFETEAIGPRPEYPPEPVGVAVGRLGRGGRVVDARYMAWGHPAGNNCGREAAAAYLRDVWRSGAELVFHNSKFDLDVAESRMGLPMPDWRRVHDTMYLVYLNDPRSPSLGLKPCGELLLGLPPEERDTVRDWLVANGVCRKSQKDWGAHISRVPAGIVGEYAVGDIKRTGGLFHKLVPSVKSRDMWAAYERERRLMPLLLDNERRGVRVDLPALRADVEEYTAAFGRVDAWLRRKLGSKDLDLDKDAQLADALDAAGLVTEWVLTPGGKRSTSKNNLKVDDGKVAAALRYRGALATCLRTFMSPWLETAERTGGWIHTNWNQTRGDNDMGTRTGRMSSNPNLQNIPNPFKVQSFGLKVPELPRVRRYIVADDAASLIGSRDYSQQELRAMAHYEDGSLLAEYRENPQLDVHRWAASMIFGVDESAVSDEQRKYTKTIGFGLIYGMGVPLLADKMGIDTDVARSYKKRYLSAMPDLKGLIDDLTTRAKTGLPIRTWGGREYYCEQPRVVKDKRTGQMAMRSFEYKMINVLVQGSSADCTKEAMVRYGERKRDGRFMAQVHDQVLISAPRKALREEMGVLRECMESVEFDAKMITDGSVGPCWDELEDVEY